MKTLDRYIAKQYVFNVAALLVLLFCFVVMVDVALNIDRMIGVATKFAGEEKLSGVGKGVLVVKLAVDLWWPRLLQLFVFLQGMVLMAAMGFTVSQIVRHRELVAMLASGISLRRAARPLLMVAVVMMGVQVLDQELVIPRIAPLLLRDHADAGKHGAREFPVPLTSDSQSRLILASKFDPKTETLTDVCVWERQGGGQATKQITAPTGAWADGAWELYGAKEVSLDVAANAQPGGRGGEGGAVNPKEAPGPPVTVRVATDLDPTTIMLRHSVNFSHSLSWRQISELLKAKNMDQAMRDKLERIRYGRVSTIISNFLAMLIVLPFFLTREPKNMVLQSLKCAPVGMVTLMGAVLGAAAPVPGLPAAVAAFLPVLVLAPIAVGSLWAMKT